MLNFKLATAIVVWLLMTNFGAAQVPEKYRDLQWHAVDTQHFEIRAMNKTHALQLKDRVEQLKSWVQDRWLLRDVPLNKKCMIMCASSAEQFREFWKLDDIDPKVTVSKDKDGVDRDVYAIWIAAGNDDSWLTSSLPEKVGRVCLMNYESVHGTEIGLWAHIGMAALDNDVGTIASLLQGIDTKAAMPGAATIMGVGKKEYSEKSAAGKLEFKRQAAAFTLFMRKEFGIKRFLAFIDSGSKRSVQQIYGFETDEEFESSYYNYVQNLVHDLRNGVTPTSYLTWSFVPKKAQ